MTTTGKRPDHRFPHTTGTLVYSVAGASLGSAGVQAMQLGNEAHQQVFDLVADNITAQ
jgi:hypothetical protein